ncbi:radical SAM protein [Halobacteriovorax sp. GB3]|uniref:B12-binding domain-containing radical SAM protein n=1 Tax=Halobacteriovorax sp. GB3 TaxID=2719615 RepID=UPI002360F603|nr:radical SAM protein [Halobacteriovorax sp. GB3]MDD0852505.1 radical SAM protein [Halobacteriovorax sp. GB3]
MSDTRVAVVVPCVVVHNLDPHTGIPFMPHMAAYFARSLKDAGCSVNVIDCFGADAENKRVSGQFMLIGLSEEEVVSRISNETEAVFVYCRTVEDLYSTELIVKELKRARPELKVCLFENIQTVNSFSLKEISTEFIEKGVDLTIFGEPESRTPAILKGLKDGDLSTVAGVAFKGKDDKVVFTEKAELDTELDRISFPLWEEFDLEGYWSCGFAHAPIKKNVKFLPLLTSRGCPFRCTFCISPTLNPVWRSRSGKDVADEMEYFYKKMGITDFHVSDLDPTVKEKRTLELCDEIIKKNIPVVWKLAQGTKIETIRKESTLDKMKEAGCVFISFSPETGSKDLLKIMNKPFDHKHGLKMVKKMNDIGIRTQACFIAGTPGETEVDRKLSISYVKKLVSSGVDEIAVTIFTPLPGAKLSDSITGYSHYSELTHSPTWRDDYSTVNWFRLRMYLTFFFFKAFRPKKVIRELIGFASKNFETKMEMSFYKIYKIRMMYFKYLIGRIFSKSEKEVRS